MRSYHQYCGLAKALDIVGDRWTLLIVRELLARGPSRYSDLQHGLPGIATNLLADRLHELVDAGVVARTEPEPPRATALFSLTEWGEELRPVVLALGRWSGRLMTTPGANDEFRSHWLALPLEGLLVDRIGAGRPTRIELRMGGQPIIVEAASGSVHVRARMSEARTSKAPDAVLTGAPGVIFAFLAGRIALDAARARGLRVEGSRRAIQRVIPSRAQRVRNAG